MTDELYPVIARPTVGGGEVVDKVRLHQGKDDPLIFLKCIICDVCWKPCSWTEIPVQRTFPVWAGCSSFPFQIYRAICSACEHV